MTGLNNVQNANALVVGASQGIGLGFVNYLLGHEAIAHVVATYHNPDSASGLFALDEKYPDRLTCLPLDATNESQVADCIAHISTGIKTLHIVINCVGFLHSDDIQPEKSLKHINADQLLRYFQVNSISGVLLAKYLIPLLRHGDRSIFASISAKIGSIGDNHLGGWYGYRASKAALNMLMRTAAIEYQRKSPNTIVVTLHPGTTDTRLSKPFQGNVPPEKLFSVERTVTQLMDVLDTLGSEDSGQFFSWDGSRLPW